MNYKTLVAASLMSIALTSAAFAQCVDCALHPDRDVLNSGAQTPASKMVQPGGAAGASTAYNTQHHRYLDEIEAGQHSIDALRDYWVARAELERAVGGKLP